MKIEKGGFRLDVVLTHANRDPKIFSNELLLQPEFSWMKGEKLGNQLMPSTKWQACLVAGAGEEAYSAALEKALLFLETNTAFFHTLGEEDAKAELVVNYSVEFDEGKVLQVSYSPIFLRQLVELGVELRVQAWSGRPE